MIITKLRLSEKLPAFRGAASWPNDYCDFNLDNDSGRNGYLVKSISGLESPEVSAQADGYDYTGVPIMRPVSEDRVITIIVELQPNPNKTNSELREDIYRLNGRLINVSLMYESDVVCLTTGFIRRIEPGLFGARSTLAITIQCTSNDFKAPTKTDIPLSTLDTTTPTIMYEEGNAPTGLDIQLTCSGAVSSFSITNFGKHWFVEAESMGTGSIYTVSGGIASLNPVVPDNRFLITYAFLTGDIILLSTHPNDRRAVRFRGSAYLDLSGYISPGAAWPVLMPGVNVFDWTFSVSGGAGIPTINTASYLARYWGV